MSEIRDRDSWGRVVRSAWIKWAKTQPSPKASWLVPYDDLSEPDKEADRQIAEEVLREAETEGAILVKERSRTISFLNQEQWDAMNERRVDLIGQKHGGKGLTKAKDVELSVLQFVSRLLVNIAHPLPFNNVDKAYEKIVEIQKRYIDRHRTIMDVIKAILDEPHIAEDCDCVNCSKVKAAKPDWQCDRCGYQGEPACVDCTCYGTLCGGEGANQRGSCCPHGFTACPVCDGGEFDVDVWAMVKRIREVIGKGATA